jgi:hypothetical protein
MWNLYSLNYFNRSFLSFSRQPNEEISDHLSDFLFFYANLTAMEGLWSVFGEFELAYYGVSREQMVLSLCVGSAIALFVGTFLGVLSDLM